MFQTPTDEPAAPALQAAVDSLNVAVEHLIKLVDDGALADLGAFRGCGGRRSASTWAQQP